MILRKLIKVSGIGLHSGAPSNLVIRLTDRGGIVFTRNNAKIPASYDNVCASMRSTMIGESPNQVRTIEHLMAALYASGISNAAITVDSAELPILDGSAAEFIKLLKPLKTKKHSHFLVVRKPVVAKASELKIPLWMRLLNFIKGVNRDGYVRLLPLTGGAPRIEIAARLIYPNSLDIIGDESHEFVFDYNDFEKSAEKFSKEIAPARTFGTLHEWEWLKKHGMGRGANAGNVIALGSIRDVEKVCSLGFEIDPKLIRSLRVKDQRKIIALNGLKFLNEFVRHKIVDVVGDLYTSGYGIIGRFESFKGSHALNNLLLRRLFSDSANYELLLGE